MEQTKEEYRFNEEISEAEAYKQELLDEELQEDIDTITSTSENILRNIVQSYKEGYNAHNDKYEIDYFLTITNHKIDVPKQGKKDIAYLRLERGIKSKVKEIEDPKVEGITIPEMQMQLVHQEMHVFNSIQERLNPKAPWRESLYLRCLYRLAGAGLEYAELLQRMKTTNLEEEKKQEEFASKLVITDQMPTPLSPDEQKYKEEIAAMKKAEGI